MGPLAYLHTLTWKKNNQQQGMKRRMSKRFSTTGFSNHSMSRSIAILQNFNFNNSVDELEHAKQKHGIWSVAKMAALSILSITTVLR